MRVLYHCLQFVHGVNYELSLPTACSLHMAHVEDMTCVSMYNNKWSLAYLENTPMYTMKGPKDRHQRRGSE